MRRARLPNSTWETGPAKVFPVPVPWASSGKPLASSGCCRGCCSDPPVLRETLAQCQQGRAGELSPRPVVLRLFKSEAHQCGGTALLPAVCKWCPSHRVESAYQELGSRLPSGTGLVVTSTAIISQRPVEGILMSLTRFYVLATSLQPHVKTKGILRSHVVWSPQLEEGLTSALDQVTMVPTPPSFWGLRSFLSAAWTLAERPGVARVGWPRGCL